MSTIPLRSTPGVEVMRTGNPSADSLTQTVLRVLAPCGSLKIAVGSFAAAIILVLVGTLAQVGMDIWQVLELYFKPWITWVPASVMFPKTWFPHLSDGAAARSLALITFGGGSTCAFLCWANAKLIPRAAVFGTVLFVSSFAAGLLILFGRGFYFPGGATIGLVMVLNLLAAHLTRFQSHAKGRSLALGLILTCVGLCVTWLIISRGHNAEGFQDEPPFAWTTLWQWVKVSLSLVALGLIAYAVLDTAQKSQARWLWGIVGVFLAITSFWLWQGGERLYLGDSGMRVLWQLIMATFAGIVLLLGAIPLFARRAGIVVLHFGVLLLMFGGWYVSNYDSEEQMQIGEGQARNYAHDVRSVEIAVIRPQSPDYDGKDDVTAVLLTKNGNPTEHLVAGRITDPLFPFDIEILEYEKSSSVAMKKGDETTPATDGTNRDFRIVKVAAASGAMASTVDLFSGYFRFIDRATKKPLGTYLLSQEVLGMRDGMSRVFDTETVKLGDISYEVQVRFLRNYKPYSVFLQDVQREDYPGTSTPKHYASIVRLTDPARNVDEELNIWMNNPRRYAGETFYQSGYHVQGDREYTTLQVVRNRGWMIPYVACMICTVGMLYHFSIVLIRFLDRRARLAPAPSAQNWLVWAIIPTLVFLAVGLFVANRSKTPKPNQWKDGFDLYAFGQLPLQYQARIKPFDTLARNALRIVSDRETFTGVMPIKDLEAAWPEIEKKLKAKYPEIANVDLAKYRNGDSLGLIKLIREKSEADDFQIATFVEGAMFAKGQPAIRWLLDVVTGSEMSRRHPVVRIYDPEVRDLLGLPKRQYYRYALEEIAPKMDAFVEKAAQADEQRRQDQTKLTLFQRKILETDKRLRMIIMLHRSFSPPDLPELPSGEEFQADKEKAITKFQVFQQALMEFDEAMASQEPPLALPPAKPDGRWRSYASEWPREFVKNRMFGQEMDPAFRLFNEILLAYIDGQTRTFNDKVATYQRTLSLEPPADLRAKPSMINTWAVANFGSFFEFESFYNHLAPLWWCTQLYLIQFILLAIGWIAWHRTFNRVAFWLNVATFVIHSAAIVARIYLSGRPPVTNLYSSAVMIGWGVAAFSIVFECIYRNGLAGVVLSPIAFLALLIAHKLAGDGDTMHVMQAVLDTQFWLATHVNSVVFGYFASFVAGGMGILYIELGLTSPKLFRQHGNNLSRTIYGTICFAIFFAFVGTILGGLWADESWGRFWGWDPKENGALIIVLWHALVLHARWDGLIRDRGMAMLAAFGNVVTAWSWFGVNELNVGLHSYGFTEGVLPALAVAVFVHLLVILLGALPLRLWMPPTTSVSLASDV